MRAHGARRTRTADVLGAIEAQVGNDRHQPASRGGSPPPRRRSFPYSTRPPAYAASRRMTVCSRQPISPGPTGSDSEGMTLLADDRPLRLAVEADGFAAKSLNEERPRGEMDSPGALDATGVEAHAESITRAFFSPSDASSARLGLLRHSSGTYETAVFQKVLRWS